MHYSVRHFELDHLKRMDVRDETILDKEFLLSHPDFEEYWERHIPLFTLFYKDEPIMIHGMQNSCIGTYFPLAICAKGIDKHKFAVIRCMYDYVEKFVGPDLRRLEAHVSVHDKKAQHFVEFFGFEPVGYKRQAAVDGSDQIIYERLGRK